MNATILVAPLALTHAPKFTECLIARDGRSIVSFSQFVAVPAAARRDYATLSVSALASKDPVVAIVEFGSAKVVVGNEAALVLSTARVSEVLRVLDALAEETAWTTGTRPAATLARLHGELVARSPARR